MKIISNTGPLIALSHINKLDLLNEIFTEVILPKTVKEEFLYKGNESIPRSFVIKEVKQPIDSFLLEHLDKGEREVVSISINEKPDYVLIDERKGRKIAELYYNLPVLGTAGILLIAKKKNLITSVRI